MRIAQLAPLAESVPPKGYGGTELVVSLLTDELFRRGHQVTLFASGDSVTDAELISCSPEGLRVAPGIPPTRWHAFNIRAILALEKMQGQFDIIHNHMGYAALPALRNFKCPTVTTNHNPVYDYCADIFLACKELPYISISEAYRRLNYPNDLNYIATVYNGINLDDFKTSTGKERKHLLFLGRLCADKGTLEAIQIAKEVGLPIKLAGKVDDNDKDYFEREIRPLLNEEDVQFIGEVSTDEKAVLYSEAIATLCPIKFEEPFGLVFSESLASGTPVMAFGRGAAPEVISDGETGVIGRTVEDLVKRFGEIEKITPETCRKRVSDLFSKEKMTDGYEKAFEQIVAGALAQSKRR